MEPRDHVNQLQQSVLANNPEILSTLGRALDRLQKAFPRRGHFILEFLQNASDAGATWMEVDLNREGIVIRNSGRPFSAADVTSICNVGLSTKAENPGNYIGYLGMGIKSSFLVSDCVQVYSGGYRIKFDRWAKHGHGQTLLPWQITPIWVDEEGPVRKGYNTIFALPFKRSADADLARSIGDEISPEHFSARTLLFLPNLVTLTFRNGITGAGRGVEKRLLRAESTALEQWELTETDETGRQSQEYWIVFRKECIVPPQVAQDLTTVEWERGKVQRREVAIAISLDSSGATKRVQGTAHTGVFSYLPLREVPTALPFLVQSDFLTAPGRHVLQDGARWNEWLLAEAYGLVRDEVLPALLSHPKWRFNVTEVLYPGGGGPTVVRDFLMRPLQQALRQEACLIATDGTRVRAAEAVAIRPDVMEWLEPSDLEGLYPGKRVLSNSANIHSDILADVEQGPDLRVNFISREMARLLELKRSEQDDDFFRRFYHHLAGYPLDQLRRWAQNASIIVTPDWQLKTPRECYISDEDYGEIEGREWLPPSNWGAPEIDRMIEELVGQISDAALDRHALQNEDLPRWRREWAHYTEQQRIQVTVMCRDFWARRELSVDQLEFLTLKTRYRGWHRPAEVLFSSPYHPQHRLEELKNRGLFDLSGQPGIDFVADDYQAVAPDAAAWHGFFTALGLDSMLKERGQEFVNQIGYALALDYELRQGRRPKASMHNPAYHLESQGRLVHVQATESAQPEVRLNNRHFHLLQEGVPLYIYVVTGALTSPKLEVVSAARLLGLVDSMRFRYQDWKGQSEGCHEQGGLDTASD